MTSYLTTSEERDAFLQWLETKKDEARATKIDATKKNALSDLWYYQGVYETYLAILAHVKTGGKL